MMVNSRKLESGDINTFDEYNSLANIHSSRKSTELRRVIFEDQTLRRSQLQSQQDARKSKRTNIIKSVEDFGSPNRGIRS